MTTDISLSPSLQPLLREGILFWVKDASHDGTPLSDLKSKGLDFLADWDNLSLEEKEAVGEIMSCLFRVEDMGESPESVQQVAQDLLRKPSPLLESLANFISRGGLINHLLVEGLARFAFSPNVLAFPDQFMSLLNAYQQSDDMNSFPINNALAKVATRIIDDLKQGKVDLATAKLQMVTLLACLHPSLVSSVSV